MSITLKSIRPINPTSNGRQADSWEFDFDISVDGVGLDITIKVERNDLTPNQALAKAWMELQTFANLLSAEIEHEAGDHRALAEKC